MKRFELNQRVVIRRPLNDERTPLKGLAGIVVRLLIRTRREAWVRMDRLPEEFRCFPAGDERENHLLVDISECEPEGRA